MKISHKYYEHTNLINTMNTDLSIFYTVGDEVVCHVDGQIFHLSLIGYTDAVPESDLLSTEDFLQQHLNQLKAAQYIVVAYRQVAGNYRTAVESIARILPERMKHCRFEKALHLVAMGCLYADMDETTLIESDDEYCLVETGGDIYEMLETGTLPRKQECTADLSYHFSTEKYRRYLLKGAVKLFHSILQLDDTVFLSAFPYDVLVGCQQGEMIRECERYVAAGATIPLKAYGKRPLYPAEGQLFVETDGWKMNIPVEKLFGYCPQEVSVSIDIEPSGIFKLKLKEAGKKEEHIVVQTELI